MFKTLNRFKPNIGRFKVPGSKFSVNLPSNVPIVQKVQIVQSLRGVCPSKVEGFKSLKNESVPDVLMVPMVSDVGRKKRFQPNSRTIDYSPVRRYSSRRGKKGRLIFLCRRQLKDRIQPSPPLKRNNTERVIGPRTYRTQPQGYWD